MSEESQPGCELRRRRSSTASLPLQLDVGSQVSEGGPSRGTPSPCTVQYVPDADAKEARRSALREFRKKQQSFDIQIEECEEEEIIVDSDDDGEPEEQPSRAITPMP
ncbi:hypothetical protein EVAR_93168_1 [Eumeta japonica]|uniref:Uncharacterized protein n=1 Tax=Eumeta variegata TaxID=151549 RepID=A0A4C1TIK3_EUMVA|nr:hypothetical protein EVAR_93168_1 [Eumeta japonica]